MAEPPRVAEPAEESQVSQIRQGGTAHILLPEVPDCLNPYLPQCEGAEALIGTVLEAPLAVGPMLEYRPFLVEQMPSYDAGTLSLEPLTVELRLRAGVAFSDGEPLTSADVRWTYEQAIRFAKNGDIASPYDGFRRVSRIETPDERTARLVFDEPYALWRDLLTAPILHQHLYEGEDFSSLRLDEELVGSGAFSPESMMEKRIHLTENQSYWSEEPLPNLEGLEIRRQPPEKAAKSLSNGRTDFGFFATTRKLPNSGDLLRAAAAPVRVENLLFNSRKLDGDVRAYISRRVDRKRIAEGFGGPVAQSFVPPKFVPGYTPVWEDYGPSGSPNAAGTVDALDLVYPYSSDPVREKLVADVVSELSDAGIEVEPRSVPSGEPFEEVLAGGDFDLALLTTGTVAGYETLSPGIPTNSKKTLEQALRTLDTEERARVLRQAQEVLAEQTGLLPLFVWPDTMIWSSTLTGPRPNTPYKGLMSNAREWAFYK